MKTVLILALLVISVSVCALIAASFVWQGIYDRHQQRLSDEYIRIIEEHGFRSQAEAEACMRAVAVGEYGKAVFILSHGREV